MQKNSALEWVLRVAVAGEFLGHGVFGLQVKAGWVEYFTALGFSADTATTLLPWIGAMDVFLAIAVLVYPMRALVLWMTLWGVWTGLLRPLAGEPIWDFVERFANWGAPLALLLVMGWPKKVRDWIVR